MKEERANQKPFYKKKWFIAVIVIIILAIIGGSMGGNGDDPFYKMASENGISEHAAESISDSCKKVGIEPKNLDFQSVQDNECTALYGNYLIRIEIDSENVSLITSMQGVLYENGKVVKNASDIFLNDDDYSTIVSATQIYAEEKLKNPDSAKWPESYKEYNIKKDGNKYTVSCEFSAENSFGAMASESVIASFEWDTENQKTPTLKDIVFK